jgi:hypothetical protein
MFDKKTQISDRIEELYIMYSTSYTQAIQILRTFKEKRIHGILVNKIYSFLGLPLTRLGQYRVEFAPIFSELDAHSQKTLISSLKKIDTLFQICSSKAMQEIFI